MDPILVHVPSSWHKLRRLVEHGERKCKPNFIARYKPACASHVKVELPPNSKVVKGEEGHYFVVGPHPRYYRLCPDCEAATGGPAIL